MRQSISKFMLMVFSAIVGLSLAGFAQATSTTSNDADKAKDRRDIRQDTRDIRRDKRDRQHLHSLGNHGGYDSTTG